MKRSARPSRTSRASPSAPRVSGRFVLRIEPALHAELQLAARHAGLSLNEYCRRKLALPSNARELEPASEIVQRALASYGPELVGVVLFGSFARGEAGPSSDVDVLLVLEPTRPLTRDLYRPWDEQPPTWDAHRVEPHVVHLPERAAPGSIWAEAAIDGVVLFERDLRVSRRLGQIRRDVAEGKLVRRSIHGQPYWARGA